MPATAVASVPSLALTALRSRLDEVVGGARLAGPAWATGIAPLDAALGGGIPRGRITEVVGAMGVGKTALLRQVVTRVLQSGGWVAWVDARRTLAPQPWAGLGTRLVMVRPHDHRRGAWCADVLLRSGVFALVVLDGAPLLSRVHGVRLAQLARERDAACVILGDGTQASRVGGAVRLRVQSCLTRRRSHHEADAHRSDAQCSDVHRGFSVIVEKGGAYRTVEVSSAIVLARRVCADPEIPDRRGVARGTRHAWTSRSGGTAVEPHGAAPHTFTWGGLGASVGDVHATSPTAPITSDTTRAPVSHERNNERDLDRRTRDWANYRGRRRVADPDYGRRSRRELARERTDTILTSHSGQSRGANGTPRLGRDGGTGRLGNAEHALGRTPAGAR